MIVMQVEIANCHSRESGNPVIEFLHHFFNNTYTAP